MARDIGTFHKRTNDGILIAVRLTPGAGRDAISGVVHLDDGAARLAVRITAPARDGKGNAALIRFMAKALGVPKSALEIVSGHKQRNKALLARGDDTLLKQAITTLVKQGEHAQ